MLDKTFQGPILKNSKAGKKREGEGAFRALQAFKGSNKTWPL